LSQFDVLSLASAAQQNSFFKRRIQPADSEFWPGQSFFPAFFRSGNPFHSSGLFFCFRRPRRSPPARASFPPNQVFPPDFSNPGMPWRVVPCSTAGASLGEAAACHCPARPFSTSGVVPTKFFISRKIRRPVPPSHAPPREIAWPPETPWAPVPVPRNSARGRAPPCPEKKTALRPQRVVEACAPPPFFEAHPPGNNTPRGVPRKKKKIRAVMPRRSNAGEAGVPRCFFFFPPKNFQIPCASPEKTRGMGGLKRSGPVVFPFPPPKKKICAAPHPPETKKSDQQENRLCNESGPGALFFGCLNAVKCNENNRRPPHSRVSRCRRIRSEK